MDKELSTFFGKLPSELNQVSLKRHTYVGSLSGNEKLASIDDISGSFVLLPFFFQEEFPEVPIEKVRALASAAMYGSLHIFVEDKIIDQGSGKTEIVLLSNILLHKALHNLYRLFQHDSDYWKYFDAYYEEYIIALLNEKQNVWQMHDQKEFVEISKGKSSLLKCILCGLAILGDKKHVLPVLNRTLDYFVVALQLMDDIVDWKEDFESKQLSPMLHSAISDFKSENKDKDLNVEELQTFLYGSTIIESTLEESNVWLYNSLDAVKDLKCDPWKNYLKYCIEGNNRKRNDIIDVKRSSYPHPPDTC